MHPKASLFRRILPPALLFALAAAGLNSAGAARLELDLSGAWQMQKTNQLLYPPGANWQTSSVPGYISGPHYERAWFRTAFAIPSSMNGTRLKLRFGGVKFDSKVWLNGMFVGGYLNGYEPFELDVTTAALVGQTNELIVGVADWTATFSAPVDFSNLDPYENPRDHATNTILAPIGGRYDLYGIWQPVRLISVPAVSIEDVFVMPSTRLGQLSVRLTVRNESGAAQTVSITNQVLDASTPVLALPNQQIVIPAGATNQMDITAAWAAPQLWNLQDPHLYFLETTIGVAGAVDLVRTRFGFREFWCQGDKCYLNGTPVNLLAASTWPHPQLLSDVQIRQVLTDVKAGNNVALRLHTQPWDEKWYTIADEVGLLIVEEGAVWCDSSSYRLADPVFWSNFTRHWTAALQRDRNHPSIILWSLQNELLHCGGERAYAGTESQLAALGATVKALDPTRPITYEADLDPDGAAHVIGLHYPYEYPDHAVWPNAAWWMDQFIARDWVTGGQWRWDHTKPLYIGEFLWVPSTSAADFTILFGDEAYTDKEYYRNRAKAMTWRMAIEAYRAYGVNGICPWTMFEDPAVRWGEPELHPEENQLYQAQKAAYHPNAVFVKEYDTRFFAGSNVVRTAWVYNDRPTAGSFTLRWRAGAGATWQTRTFTLQPAEKRQETLTFQAPGSPGSFPLQTELLEGTTAVFTNSAACSAFLAPSLAAPAALKLGLYDPQGSVAGLLNRFGIPFTAVSDLRTAPYGSLQGLIVGRHALQPDATLEVGPGSPAGQWESFMLRGGWLFILEQTNYPSWMPYDLRIENFDASFAFPHPAHPVTEGLTAEDLRWWAPDHRVVTRALRTPSRGNVRVISPVGSRSGLEYAAAIEMPVGSGGLLAAQWLVTERFDVEPMAGVLFQRMLNYIAQPQGHWLTRPAGLVAETHSPAAAKLAELGLLAENLSGRLTNADPAVHPVLVIAGGDAAWQEATQQLNALADYAQRGGRLVLHRPPDAFLAAAQPLLLTNVDWAGATLGMVLRRDSTNAAVRAVNHDLYWIEQSGSWNQPEILSTNVARRIYRKKFALTNYATLQVEDMPTKTSGGATAGGWILWSNGYVAQKITNTQAGTFLFDVKARGTPAYGEYPRLTLRIDGHAQDLVTVASNPYAYYTLAADLAAGVHELALVFDNDAWNPPNEDRNLYLDEIRWGLDADAGGVTLLTKPGAVAQVRRGSGLVVLDEIAWEEESRNATKAGRYASTLLTGLGAAMRTTPALGIEAESMTNVNVNAYSVSQGIAWCNSNGRIETRVNFTAAGNYTFELVALGRPALGTNPLVAIQIDGVTQRTVSITTSNLARFAVSFAVSAGSHVVALAFLNDHYAPPEDRNVGFDRLTIIPEATPRILGLSLEAATQSATLSWEGTAGKFYDVLFAAAPMVGHWQPAGTVTNSGRVGTWRDTGAQTTQPPGSPTAPQRFYHVRQPVQP